MTVPSHREAFGSRLRELRIARGLSQEDLAHEAGLDRSYVGGVERGQRNVSLDNIHKLAEALGVDISNLF
jgi:transcriptional regulator with XRE-family HTH domain